jgi:Uma2 family endonuclease
MPLAYTEHYTVADHKAWKGDWELIRGAPYAMSPSPSVSHQRVNLKIARQLDEQLENCPKCTTLIETDWEVASDTVIRPDSMVICHEPGERITRTPEIIFEVISPATAKRDELLKFELYQQEGVAWYILVYPQTRTAKVYQRINAQFQKTGDYSEETHTFELKDCAIEFDFSAIWRKLS